MFRNLHGNVRVQMAHSASQTPWTDSNSLRGIFQYSLFTHSANGPQAWRNQKCIWIALAIPLMVLLQQTAAQGLISDQFGVLLKNSGL